MLTQNDRSSLPVMQEQIAAYQQTLLHAAMEAEAYALQQMEQAGAPGSDTWNQRQAQLLNQLYQGDDGIGASAIALLDRALITYDGWATP